MSGATSAAFGCLAIAATAAFSAEPVKVLYGFEDPKDVTGMVPVTDLVESHGTEGKKALKIGMGFPQSWKYIRTYAEGKPSGLMGQPPEKGAYEDVLDWFYQRNGSFLDDAQRFRDQQRDWSPYAYLRFDVFCEQAPAILGLRLFDSNGPRIPAHYLGVRSGLALFRLPQDREVTCEVPLTDMTTVAEMDLTKMMGFNLRINGYAGDAVIFVDNVRLVSKDAAAGDARYPVVKMDGVPQAYARPVFYNPVRRDPEKMKPVRGAAAKAGPVTVFTGNTLWNASPTAFGGSGVTYNQSLRRGCVAWDDKRLLLLLGANGMVVATASFDGGTTWGGITPGEKEPARLASWGVRGSGASDATGDLYVIGTQNCSSYHEGYDMVFRRLALVGEGWKEERMSLISQHLRKCPCESRAWRLPSGRIWTTYSDGWGGIVANFSDDDGYTWEPCKDASSPLPRPFYEPSLDDLKKPLEQRAHPPREILPWAGWSVCGWTLLPLKGQMAVVGMDGVQLHDGKAWGPVQKSIPKGFADVAPLGDRLFLARGGTYGDVLKVEKRGKLEVAWQEGDAWKQETLEPGSDIGDVILSSCGDAMFCFYVKVVKEGDEENVNEVYARRCKDGKWGGAQLLATEKFRINRLAAPLVGAPNYAAVWWDERPLKAPGRKQTPPDKVVRFARIPNE
jgi:hypothetical protein